MARWRSGNAAVCKTAIQGFDSPSGLSLKICPGGGTGIHARLKILWPMAMRVRFPPRAQGDWGESKFICFRRESNDFLY